MSRFEVPITLQVPGRDRDNSGILLVRMDDVPDIVRQEVERALDAVANRAAYSNEEQRKHERAADVYLAARFGAGEPPCCDPDDPYWHRRDCPKWGTTPRPEEPKGVRYTEILGTCNNCGHLDVPLDANYCPKCGGGRTTPAETATPEPGNDWVEMPCRMCGKPSGARFSPSGCAGAVILPANVSALCRSCAGITSPESAPSCAACPCPSCAAQRTFLRLFMRDYLAQVDIPADLVRGSDTIKAARQVTQEDV